MDHFELHLLTELRVLHQRLESIGRLTEGKMPVPEVEIMLRVAIERAAELVEKTEKWSVEEGEKRIRRSSAASKARLSRIGRPVRSRRRQPPPL